jgi:hypothetical protein
MMVTFEMRVECSAKIAMTALRGRAAAMCLLRNHVLPRRIFLGTRTHEFVDHKRGREIRPALKL